MTKLGLCDDAGCNGKLLWEDGITPFDFAESGLDRVDAGDGWAVACSVDVPKFKPIQEFGIAGQWP